MITNALTIAGTDFSSLLQKYGITEVVREVNGPNAGTSINGDAIYDIVAKKTDLTIKLKPLTPAQYASLVTKQLSNPVSVTYYSFAYNASRTITGRLSVSSATMAMNTADRTLYEGVSLTISQK